MASGGAWLSVGSSSFTQSAGTLTLTGTLTESSGTFTQSGGALSGNPVDLTGGALADSGGTGALEAAGTISLTGTVPVGQTVTGNGGSGSADINVPSAVTVDGTLTLESSSSGNSTVSGAGSVTVASGGTFTTEGTADSVFIQVPVTNQSGGTVTIGATTTAQNNDTLTSNAGSFTVATVASSPSVAAAQLTDTATGTLGVTVNGTAATGGISGSGVTVTGSTLAVTTVGSPTVGSTFTPISGPVTGTFSKFAFGDAAYTVSYPSGSVLLTTGTPFIASPTSFSASANIPTGPVEVATIGSATEGTGTYSATVNYGDVTPIVVASVAITGNTGKVTAPSHTYTTPGTFTVTTSVANTDGTTVTTTKNITVTGDQATYSCIVSGFATRNFPVVFSESPPPPSTIDAGGTFATDLAARVTIPASVINHYIGRGATSLTVSSQSATEDGLTSGGSTERCGEPEQGIGIGHQPAPERRHPGPQYPLSRTAPASIR